jgi:hypothetical protein
MAEAVRDVAEHLRDLGHLDLLERGKLARVDQLLPRPDELGDAADLRPLPCETARKNRFINA